MINKNKVEQSVDRQYCFIALHFHNEEMRVYYTYNLTNIFPLHLTYGSQLFKFAVLF